jgi:hypothetical protein
MDIDPDAEARAILESCDMDDGEPSRSFAYAASDRSRSRSSSVNRRDHCTISTVTVPRDAASPDYRSEVRLVLARATEAGESSRALLDEVLARRAKAAPEKIEPASLDEKLQLMARRYGDVVAACGFDEDGFAPERARPSMPARSGKAVLVESARGDHVAVPPSHQLEFLVERRGFDLLGRSLRPSRQHLVEEGARRFASLRGPGEHQADLAPIVGARRVARHRDGRYGAVVASVHRRGPRAAAVGRGVREGTRGLAVVHVARLQNRPRLRIRIDVHRAPLRTPILAPSEPVGNIPRVVA